MNQEMSLPWYRYFWAWVVVLLPTLMVIFVSSLVVFMMLHPLEEIDYSGEAKGIQSVINSGSITTYER